MLESVYINVAGIDPGIRKTFGYVLGTFCFQKEASEVIESFKKSELKTNKRKNELFSLLVKNGLIDFVVFSSGVFDFSSEVRRETMEAFTDELKKWKTELKKIKQKSGSDVAVYVEDFLFFNLDVEYIKRNNVQTTSWFTVSKMQNAIGYVCGYLTACGYRVSVVKPSQWKAVVEPHYVVFASRVLCESNLTCKDKRTAEHIKSAVGIAVYASLEQFLSSFFPSERR